MATAEKLATKIKKVKDLAAKAQKDHRKKQLKKQLKRLSRKGHHLKARTKRFAATTAAPAEGGEKATG